MIVIGVAGGVASGKSLVTSCFQHFGAVVLDGDGEGHQVLRQPDVVKQIVARWGTELLSGDEIDRRRLARIVFAEGAQDQLKYLEQITHPRIAHRLRSRLDELRTSQSWPAAVLDAPVMFKAGWDQFCDKIVFVDTPRPLRQQRAAARGWDAGELDRRESVQLGIDLKRARSTDVIDNSGSREETYAATAKLWRRWGLPLTRELDTPSTLFPI